MPELPEVETVRRGLEQTIVGATVASVNVRVPKLFPVDRALIDRALVGQRIERILRRAKLLLVELSNGWTLVIHLKMTGQIIVRSEKLEARSSTHNSSHFSQLTSRAGFVGGHPEKVYEQPLPHRHTHVIITFTDPTSPKGSEGAGSTVLYFNDLRKFGWMRLFRRTTTDVRSTGQTIDEFLASLNHGPEPLEPSFTLNYFRELLAARKTPIKPLLLDQSFIAGIGNMYADEALFAAAIQPTLPANSLKKSEAERLFQAIKDVLELGIAQGGTSFNSYRNVQGTAGKMREHLRVYGRAGQPCFRCGGRIVRTKIGQRSAHVCPTCQR
jgi:formamidopyrimidine-DNA glycosylase